MASRIIIRKDGSDLSEVPLAPPMTVGRHPKANIQLEDPMMSREHARITVEGSRLFITDTNSANGVKLGGRRIPRNEPQELHDGDVASILSYELVFRIDSRGVSDTRDLSADDLLQTRPPPSPNLEHLLEQGIPIWTSEKDVELKVAEIIEEAPDVKTFRLVGKRPLLFSYRPGQFLTVKVEVDGKQKNRCYSISSSPSRPHTLEITVKRARAPVPGVPDGVVSNHLHDHVKLGDTLRVHGPAGDFSCFNYPSGKILCIAAGSGITPIMSMCRWIVDTRADVDVAVLLSFKSPADIIFRRELELMSSRHNDLKVILSVTSRNAFEPWTGLSGRLCTQMFQMAVPDLAERHTYLCGPNGFMDTVRQCLKELEFPTENLHSESFGKSRVEPGAKAREKEPTPPVALKGAEPAAPARLFTASFKKSGIVAKTDGAGGLLELAEAHGVNIPAGCRMGSCLVCKVKCLGGQVRMEENKLTPELKRQGYVVTCVGHADSDVVLEA
jgi:ferredoxin-NADP reductase